MPIDVGFEIVSNFSDIFFDFIQDIHVICVLVAVPTVKPGEQPHDRSTNQGNQDGDINRRHITYATIAQIESLDWASDSLRIVANTILVPTTRDGVFVQHRSNKRFT